MTEITTPFGKVTGPRNAPEGCASLIFRLYDIWRYYDGAGTCQKQCLQVWCFDAIQNRAATGAKRNTSGRFETFWRYIESISEILTSCGSGAGAAERAAEGSLKVRLG